MVEQRRESRQALSLAVTEINGQPAGVGHYLVNINEFGAKIETSLAFAQGDLVEFSFVLPGEEQETRRQGKVVWMLPAPLTEGRYFVGLQFLLSPGESSLRFP